jgi:hypothetical protein
VSQPVETDDTPDLPSKRRMKARAGVRARAKLRVFGRPKMPCKSQNASGGRRGPDWSGYNPGGGTPYNVMGEPSASDST